MERHREDVGPGKKSESAKLKRERFVQEYLIDLNATRAAIRAGYSRNAAHQQGTRLLSNASIRAAIESAQKARSERTQVDQDWVIQRLVRIARRAYLAEEYGAANRALELLGKNLGMFAGPKDTPPINVNVATNTLTTNDLWRDVKEFDAAFRAAEIAERAEEAAAQAGHNRDHLIPSYPCDP